MAKYTLTKETQSFRGITLHRVKYFDGVSGGWIES